MKLTSMAMMVRMVMEILVNCIAVLPSSIAVFSQFKHSLKTEFLKGSLKVLFGQIFAPRPCCFLGFRPNMRATRLY
jgi:hypothetical protein